MPGVGMPVVFMFPGQSSRDSGMVERAFQMAPGVAGDVFGEASELLGRDLRSHYFDNPAEMFATNRDIQLGVFLVNHVHLKALEAAGVEADLSLGLSLGEYNHVVHIGALDFADAVRLVDERGRLYSEGPHGVMAAIFPIDVDALTPLIEDASSIGPVGIAVMGSPSQTVVAGQREAVDHVAARADDEEFAQAVTIEERVPMHVALFEPVAEQFAPVLAATKWQNANKPYLPNVEGHFVPNDGPSTYIEPLRRHVYQTVKWRQSIDFLFSEFPAEELVFVEVGPRKSLTNLLSPKWHKTKRLHTDRPDEPAERLANVVEELQNGPR